MDNLTLAMAKPKVIDLDSYGIGQTILYHFSTGGGSNYQGNLEQFWSDIDTNRVLRLEMNVDALRIQIDQCIRAKRDGIVNNIAFTFSAMYGSDFYTISVNIMRDGDGAEITVKVSV